MKKVLSLILVLSMIISAFSMQVFAADGSSTALKTVQYLGIISGDESGNLNLDEEVTRAEFVKMLVSATEYKDAVDDVTTTASFSDISSTDWEAPYVEIAVENDWISGYLDGTFRPDDPIKLQEAVTVVLRALGYTDDVLDGTYPTVQMKEYKVLDLDDDISASSTDYLTREDAVYLFYNMLKATTYDGSVYAEDLGYSLDDDGDIDYTALINDELDGPYVIEDSGWMEDFTFNVEDATIYLNGTESDLTDLETYDVIYFNKNVKTIWAYRNSVTGIITAVDPSTVDPTSVTIADTEYTLGTTDAEYAVSSTGEYGVGDSVALLIGMDNEVVDIVDPTDINSITYGVVTATNSSTYTNQYGKSSLLDTVTVMGTDGNTHSYSVDDLDDYDLGDVVSARRTSNGTTVSVESTQRIGGTVNSAGTKLDDDEFASDIGILDIDSAGNYAIIYPSRIAGDRIPITDVLFYAYNDDGELSALILDDATGDLDDYGVLTNVDEDETEATSTTASEKTGTYKYLVDGESSTFTTSGKFLDVDAVSGIEVIASKAGGVSTLKELGAVKVSKVTETAITGTNNMTYEIADNVQVYLKSGTDYKQTNVDAILDMQDDDDYLIYGYYDDGHDLGDMVRIIVVFQESDF